jgi:hypothetical protein
VLLDDQADAFIDFAQAAEVTGESHPSANAVSLNVVRHNGHRATLTVPADDLQRLVSMLLLLGRTLASSDPPRDSPLSLIPTDSLHVGPLPSGETLLAVGIGPATVSLSLPTSAVEKLARSLLAAVAVKGSLQ